MRADIQISSPYHSSLALNRGGFPEGSACHHFDPIRYVVRGASHPVISATVARPRRDQQEHAGCSTFSITACKYTQLRDIVSRLTLRVSREACPRRLDAMVRQRNSHLSAATSPEPSLPPRKRSRPHRQRQYRGPPFPGSLACKDWDPCE